MHPLLTAELRRLRRLVIDRIVSTKSNSCCVAGGRRSDADSLAKAFRVRLRLAGTRRRKKKKRLCRCRGRFAPFPKRPIMFKRGFPSEAMVNNQTAASVPPAPPAAAFNMQYNNQAGYSPFTPEYQQFPYTFSSATPPLYSWANTNSTDIMKFTGSSCPQAIDTSSYHPSNFGMVPKRKIDLDAELPQPPKMRITEEKVSASLRDMHISNEFKSHNHCLSSNVSEMDTIDDLKPTNVNPTEITKTESQTTLVMCEELRKLNKIDSIIPQPLLNVVRPSNAVIVWKPQPIIDLVRTFTNYEEPKSTVVITEITDEEDNQLTDQDQMFVEDDNCIAIEDDSMEL